MNSLSQIVARGSLERFLSAFPLSVLGWLEMQALKLEHARLLRQSRQQDGWYLFCGGHTCGPEKFTQILRRLIAGESSIAILHESAAQDEEAQWTFISYRAWALHPVISTIWTIGFWALGALFGWVLVCLSLPHAIRGYGEGAYGFGLLAFVVFFFARGVRSKSLQGQKAKREAAATEYGS